jgi:hypothetical protein
MPYLKKQILLNGKEEDNCLLLNMLKDKIVRSSAKIYLAE